MPGEAGCLAKNIIFSKTDDGMMKKALLLKLDVNLENNHCSSLIALDKGLR